MNLEELAVVHNGADDAIHVVGLVGIVRDDGVEAVLQAVHRVRRLLERRGFQVVLGDIAQELLDGGDGFLLVGCGKMRHAALGGMHGSAAQLFLVHHLAGDALHHGGAGQEHVGGVFHHEGEVREGGGIHRTAGAGTHDAADLRHHAGREDVALENLSIAGQGIDAFLDTCTAGIVEADARGAVAQGHVLYLADFLAHGLGQGTAAHREVLGKNVNQAAVDGAAAGNHAVAVRMALVHSEVGAAVLYKHVKFFKAAFVQQQGQAFPGRHFSFGVLGLDAFFTTAHAGLGPAFHQFLNIIRLDTHIVSL